MTVVDVVRLPLEVAGAAVSPVGLALPDEMRVNDWERVGVQLERAHNANLWWIADWAAYGDRWFRKDYPLLLDKVARHTMWNLASVARNVEATRRREDLSFTHHAEVAALEPDEQTEWLADAFDHGWSTRELRERVAAWRRGDRVAAAAGLTVRAPGELAALFARAAERAGAESPAAWAISVLETAAREQLGELEAVA